MRDYGIDPKRAAALGLDELEPEVAARVAVADTAYLALDKLGREANASVEELGEAIAGAARPFYLAACLREAEALASLPLPDFKDKCDRWFKNWREIYRAVVRARGEMRAAG